MDCISKCRQDAYTSHDLLEKTLRALTIKIPKLQFITIKNVYSSRDTIKKTKRQTTDCEKIFAKHVSNKGLRSRIQKLLK